MRTHLISFLAAVLATTTAVACKKGADGDAPSSGSKPTESAAPEQLSWKKIGALGVEVEVPAGAEIDDNTSGAGFPMATLWTSPTMFVSGAGEMSDLKPTLEETKQQLGKDPNKLKAFTKEETTADGWILELTREAMVEPGKELLGISIRRTIDGKPWDCGSNVSTPAELAKVKRICQSLRAAK